MKFKLSSLTSFMKNLCNSLLLIDFSHLHKMWILVFYFFLFSLAKLLNLWNMKLNFLNAIRKKSNCATHPFASPFFHIIHSALLFFFCFWSTEIAFKRIQFSVFGTLFWGDIICGVNKKHLAQAKAFVESEKKT